MSTKKIREALERLRRCDIGVDEALAEGEAIEKAACLWSADEMTDAEYEEAQGLMDRIAKESGR